MLVQIFEVKYRKFKNHQINFWCELRMTLTRPRFIDFFFVKAKLNDNWFEIPQRLSVTAVQGEKKSTNAFPMNGTIIKRVPKFGALLDTRGPALASKSSTLFPN